MTTTVANRPDYGYGDYYPYDYDYDYDSDHSTDVSFDDKDFFGAGDFRRRR